MGGLFTGIIVALGLGAVAYAAIRLARSAETGTRGINAVGDRVAKEGIFSVLFPQSKQPFRPAGLPAGNTGIVPPNLQWGNPAENPANWGSLTKDLALAGKTIADIFRDNERDPVRNNPNFEFTPEQIELVEVGPSNRSDYVGQLDTGSQREPD